MSEKKKMNTYVKFTVVLLISGFVGGVLGYLTGMGEGDGLLTSVAAGYDGLVSWIRYNLLFVLSGAGAVSILLCEMFLAQLKRAGLQIENASDEQIDEIEYHMELAGSKGMIISVVGMILQILILSTGYSKRYIQGLADGKLTMYMIGLFVFIAMTVYFSFWQIRYVKLIQKYYPGKKGDPASLKFQKQWFESCDEAEKECINQASRKTYLLLGRCFPIFTFVAMISHLLWNTGLLAIIMPALLWMIASISYCISCVQKKREGYNG